VLVVGHVKADAIGGGFDVVIGCIHVEKVAGATSVCNGRGWCVCVCEGATKTISIGTNRVRILFSRESLSWPGLSGDKGFASVAAAHGIRLNGCGLVAHMGKSAGLTFVGKIGESISGIGEEIFGYSIVTVVALGLSGADRMLVVSVSFSKIRFEIEASVLYRGSMTPLTASFRE
jgi:hypothetical protein